MARMSKRYVTPVGNILGMTDLLSQTIIHDDQEGFVRHIHESALS